MKVLGTGLIAVFLTAFVLEAFTDRDWTVTDWEWPEIITLTVLVVIGAIGLISIALPGAGLSQATRHRVKRVKVRAASGLHFGHRFMIGLTAVAGCLAVLVAARETHNTFASNGQDYVRIRAAALALWHGRSIYTDPLFVYPPTASIAFLPTGLGSSTTALHAWFVLCTAATSLAIVVALAPSRMRTWPLLAAVAVALTLKGDLFLHSLRLGNLSLLLAPIAVLALISFEEDHWTRGCALLAASLLLKPLLVPLLALPVLRRRWRPLFVTIIPAAVLLFLAVLVVPGGDGFFTRMRYLAAGSDLHGQLAVYNDSISGLAERLDATGLGLFGRVLVAAIVMATVIAWFRGPRAPGTTAAIGVCLLLAGMLVGTLSEEHYLLVVGPCLLLALALRRQARLLALALPGFALMLFPRYYFGGVGGSPADLQTRYFIAELLLLIAAAATALVPDLSHEPARSTAVR